MRPPLLYRRRAKLLFEAGQLFPPRELLLAWRLKLIKSPPSKTDQEETVQHLLPVAVWGSLRFSRWVWRSMATAPIATAIAIPIATTVGP
jgi:hypothetical protein